MSGPTDSGVDLNQNMKITPAGVGKTQLLFELAIAQHEESVEDDHFPVYIDPKGDRS